MTLFHWMELEYCVVLHSQGKNSHVFYKGKEKSLENVRVIYLDIAESTNIFNNLLFSLFDEYDAPSNIRDQVLNPEANKPKETFQYEYGYDSTARSVCVKKEGKAK